MIEPQQALSVRAPWWGWILYGGKDIENRRRRTHYRGPVLIHASSYWDDEDEIIRDHVWSATVSAMSGGLLSTGKTILDKLKPLRGHIVGIVDIVDCIDPPEHRKQWHMPGQFGWKLANPIALEHPFPVKGMLGFFSVGALTAEVNSIMAERMDKKLAAIRHEGGILSDGS